MNQASTSDTIKFLYSYGGRIVPRLTKGRDGMLCYSGHTRILSVNQSISSSELMVKFGDLCGHLVNLKIPICNYQAFAVSSLGRGRGRGRGGDELSSFLVLFTYIFIS
ncbi:unnamed protein product [Fraxinus pennsylvanica]|uniref:Uncharacterized protein n=1 Tax=Fraxinus pennsylvanica TaxID=56036 RepID=A0AAD1YX78_9LAMI|nr:unnamed protein product [Fraxinus pennsylvanica]